LHELFDTLRPYQNFVRKKSVIMRLSPEQIVTIKQETEHFFGAQAEVWLFGSRVDDTKKGGNVLPIYALARQQGVSQ